MTDTTPQEDTLGTAVARLAAAQRHNAPEEEIDDLRNAVLAARLNRAINEALRPTVEGYKPLRKVDRQVAAHRLASARPVPTEDDLL